MKEFVQCQTRGQKEARGNRQHRAGIKKKSSVDTLADRSWGQGKRIKGMAAFEKKVESGFHGNPISGIEQKREIGTLPKNRTSTGGDGRHDFKSFERMKTEGKGGESTALAVLGGNDRPARGRRREKKGQ